jgi:hypothetical protein
MPTSDSASPLDAIRAARDWAPSLPAHLRPTWLILATYYPNIFPSGDVLAELAGGVSRRTMIRYLKELEQRGAISTERRGGGKNSRAYRTLHMPELGTASMPPDWALKALLEDAPDEVTPDDASSPVK